MKVYIKPNEHVFVAGKTGSGKTWLTRKYLSSYKNVVVLDTKGTLDWPEVPPEKLSIEIRLENVFKAKTEKIIYQPRAEEMTEEYYDEFFRWVYFRKNTIVWIDEVMSIGTPQKMPFYYKACLTRGRELQIGVWSLTQRPSNIPALTMSEATHFMVFDLNLPADRKKVSDIAGAAELHDKPSERGGRFSFWYFHSEKSKAVLVKLKEKPVGPPEADGEKEDKNG